MVRPERFELPTPWFEARYSIQLSYGRASGSVAVAARFVNPNVLKSPAHPQHLRGVNGRAAQILIFSFKIIGLWRREGTLAASDTRS